MNQLIRILLLLLLLLVAGRATAVVCSLSVNPSQVKVIFTGSAPLQVQGTIDLTCARAGDSRKPNFWIGMDQPATGRTATLDTGGSTLAYTVAHGNYGLGIWMNTGSVSPGSTTNGGIQDNTPDFGKNNGQTLTATYTFYLQVAVQGNKAAGVYVDSIPLTLRDQNISGPILYATTLDVSISLPKSCRFSTPPTAINVNYTAFSPSPVPGSSSFALTCTLGTTYTLALDATRSLIPTVELAYSLSLNAAAGSGNAAAQAYTVDISVDAGQAGRCNGATCTGTDTRTLTITY